MTNGTTDFDNPSSYPAYGTYAQLLRWHMEIWGTRAGGSSIKQGEAWRPKDFLVAVFKDDWVKPKSRVSLGAWLSGKYAPDPPNDAFVENALFGPPPAFQRWREDFRAARLRTKSLKKLRKKSPTSKLEPEPLAQTVVPATQPVTSAASREQLLIDMLFGKFDDEKRHALSELCKLSILPPGAALALERFATESDIEWRKTAANFLFEATFRKPKTADWARLFLKDQDVDIRLSALRRLSEVASKVEPEIYAALKDQAAPVRIRAATILFSRIPVTTEQVFPVAALLNDPANEVRRLAATRLLEHVSEKFVAEPGLLGDLLRVIVDHEPLWPKLIELAKTRPWLPADLVIPSLLSMLEDLFSGRRHGTGVTERREMLAMQRELCLAISRYGESAVVSMLAKLKSHEIHAVLGAIFALGEMKLKNPNVISQLSELARHSPPSLVSEAAVVALRKITGKRTVDIMGSNPFAELPTSNIYPRIDREVQVINSRGFDVREAALVVELVSRFASDVKMRNENSKLATDYGNASDLFDLMERSARRGATLVFSASGPDAYDVLDAIEAMFASKFGE